MALAALTLERKIHRLSGDVFATLARNTLRPLGTKAAPTSSDAWPGTAIVLGCYAHPPGTPLQARSRFQCRVDERSAGGLSGMAWDGNYLWLVGDSIHVIDVSGQKPRVVHTEKSSVASLSGVVAFNRHIW